MYSIILHYITLYSIILYYIVFYYIILYYIVFYYITLYYIILYCILLYYIILYYIYYIYYIYIILYIYTINPSYISDYYTNFAKEIPRKFHENSMKSPWNHHETSPVSALSPSIPSARAGHSALPPTTLCPPRFPRGWSLVPRPKIHPILDGENRPKITSELVGFEDTANWPKELGKNPMEMVIVCYSYLPGSSLYGRCTHCSRIWIPRWSVGITCQKIFPGQIKMSWDITQL